MLLAIDARPRGAVLVDPGLDHRRAASARGYAQSDGDPFGDDAIQLGLTMTVPTAQKVPVVTHGTEHEGSGCAAVRAIPGHAIELTERRNRYEVPFGLQPTTPVQRLPGQTAPGRFIIDHLHSAPLTELARIREPRWPAEGPPRQRGTAGRSRAQ